MKKVMTRLALATLFMFAFAVTADQANAMGQHDPKIKAVHTVQMPVTLFQLPNGEVVGFVDDKKAMVKTHAGPKMDTSQVTSLGLFDSIKNIAGKALSVGGAVLGGLGGSLMGGGQDAPAA